MRLCPLSALSSCSLLHVSAQLHIAAVLSWLAGGMFWFHSIDGTSPAPTPLTAFRHICGAGIWPRTGSSRPLPTDRFSFATSQPFRVRSCCLILLREEVLSLAVASASSFGSRAEVCRKHGWVPSPASAFAVKSRSCWLALVSSRSCAGKLGALEAVYP